MYSKVKIAGHPVHPMLTAFPIAFYVASFAAFVWYALYRDPFWFRVALSSNTSGVVMALAAAIPGFIDWLFIPSERPAKKTGINHMLLNVAALALFTVNLFMVRDQWDEAQPVAPYAVLITGSAVLITIAAGFLGWSLVQKHKVGVSLSPEQEGWELGVGANA